MQNTDLNKSAINNFDKVINEQILSSDHIVVKTRFGDMLVDQTKKFKIIAGPLGFADNQDYAVLMIPKRKNNNLVLLQNLDEPEISFIALPIDADENAYNDQDLVSACQELSINKADLMIIIIVSMDKEGDVVSVFGNMSAPILVDTRAQKAWQYIFTNSAYQIRQKLAEVTDK